MTICCLVLGLNWLLYILCEKDYGLTFSSSANKSGTGGHATEGKDSAGGAAKAKKEFPEAPDMIGMQDERGGRGG